MRNTRMKQISWIDGKSFETDAEEEEQREIWKIKKICNKPEQIKEITTKMYQNNMNRKIAKYIKPGERSKRSNDW